MATDKTRDIRFLTFILASAMFRWYEHSGAAKFQTKSYGFMNFLNLADKTPALPGIPPFELCLPPRVYFSISLNLPGFIGYLSTFLPFWWRILKSARAGPLTWAKALGDLLTAKKLSRNLGESGCAFCLHIARSQHCSDP